MSDPIFKRIFNLVYPVGSIYMSSNSTSPATLFGGTWVQLKDRVLVGAGDSFSNGATGGSKTKNLAHTHTTGNCTLTIDQIPAHSHAYNLAYGGNDPAKGLGYGNTLAGTFDNAAFVQKTGGGNAHNHGNTGSSLSSSFDTMPPYLVVYMWKRTA